MMHQKQTKNRKRLEGRLEARIELEIKQRIDYAASLLGRSTKDFVVACCTEQANRVIEEHRIVRLTVEQSHSFARALLNAPEPSAKEIAAVNRHKKRILSRQ